MNTRAAFFNLRRAMWRSIALLVVMLGVYVLLGRQLTPMVERTVPTLENYFSELLEQTVTIDDIQGEWRGFGPAFTIRGLSIGDDFRISNFILEPALLDSLVKGNAIFSRFSINGATIGVEHDGEGWGVPAFEAVGRDQQLQEVFDQVYNQLLEQEAIQLRNLGLTFRGFDQELAVNLIDGLIIGTHEYHELSGELLIDPDGQAVSSLVQLEARDTRTNPQLQAYLRHGAFDASSYLPAQLEGLGFQPSNLELSAEWWFDWQDGELASVQAQVQEGGVRFVTDQEESEQALDSLIGSLYWQPQPASDGVDQELKIRDLSFRYNDVLWPVSNHDVSVTPDQLTLTTDQIAISRLGAMVEPWLPMDIFSRHDIQGQLVNTQIELPRSDDGLDWLAAEVSGELQDGDFSAVDYIPGFQQVDGHFRANVFSGVIDINTGPLVVSLPDVLPEDIPMDVETGAVAWRLSDDLNLKIASSPVTFDWADQVRVDGSFAFSGSMNPDADTMIEPVLALTLAGDRLNNERLFAALPMALDPEVLDWMHTNLHDLDGGPWALALPNVLSSNLATRIGMISAEVNQLAVTIDDDWPRFEQLSGDFWLDHHGIAATLTDGEFGDVGLVNGELTLPFVEGNAEINIAAQARGLASAGWRLVTDTPLREFLSDDIAAWQMAGFVSSDVDLTIPFDESPVALTLDMDVQNAVLTMPELGLSFTDIRGPLQLSTDTGLTSERLDARLFGAPLHTAMHTQVRDNGDWDFRFPAAGEASLAALGLWLDDPWLSAQDHTVDFSGVMSTEADTVNLDLRSDLVGLPLNLPEPFDKAGEDSQPLHLQLTLDPNSRHIRAQYADQSDVHLRTTENGELVDGSIGLGSAAPALSEGTLRVDVELPTINANAWLAQWEQVQSLYDLDVLEDQPIDRRLEGWADFPLDQVRLRTDSFTFEDVTLNDLVVDVIRGDLGWVADLDSRQISGVLALSEEADQPSILDLDYVRFGEAVESPEFPEVIPVEELDEAPQRNTREPHNYRPEDDLLAALNPNMVPFMQVSLAELTLQGQSFGQWNFTVEPDMDERLIRINDLQGEIRLVEIDGNMVWDMPENDWHQTQVNLNARAGNLGDVLEASGLTPVITSERAEGSAEARWAGSPIAYQTTGVTGRVQFDARDGSLRELDDFDGIRIIGLLNVTRIFRRLSLDFRDVFTAGFTYDQVAGDLLFDEGNVSVGERLLLDGSGAKMFFGGDYDMLADELDGEGVVIARVSNTAGLIALGAGFSPPVALMVIFGERALERELERLFSVRTDITGSLAQPDVRASRLFDSDIRGNDATLEERMRELFGPGVNQ